MNAAASPVANRITVPGSGTSAGGAPQPALFFPFFPPLDSEPESDVPEPPLPFFVFPGPQLGTILGAITIGTGVGSALGSWLAGWSFDLTGSYRAAFTLSIFFYACGSVAFWLLRRPVAEDR